MLKTFWDSEASAKEQLPEAEMFFERNGHYHTDSMPHPIPHLEPETHDESHLHDPSPALNGHDASYEARHEQEPELPAEPEVLAVSINEFSALEERVLRAVNMVKRERLARIDAEDRALHAEERASVAEMHLQRQTPVLERLQAEVQTLRAERDNVRQRVERLLSQLDTLEL